MQLWLLYYHVQISSANYQLSNAFPSPCQLSNAFPSAHQGAPADPLNQSKVKTIILT